MDRGSNNSFEINECLVGAARFELTTPCAQGRCATRLRYAPTILCSSDSRPLPRFPIVPELPKSGQNSPDRGKTPSVDLLRDKTPWSSFAFRFNFCGASRFIPLVFRVKTLDFELARGDAEPSDFNIDRERSKAKSHP